MKVPASVPVILFVLAFAAIPTTAPSAQQATERFAKVLTSSPASMLNAPLGIRNLGLGTAGVADDSDPNNSYYNPANLQSQTFYYVSMGYNELMRNEFYSVDTYDAGLYGGTSLPLEGAVEVRLGFGARFVQEASTLQFDTRTIFLPEGTGQNSTTRRDWYMLLTGAIGVGIGPADVGVGVSLKPYSLERTDQNVNQWAFDAGVVASVDFLEDGPVSVTPSIGASVLNLGDDVGSGAPLAPAFTRALPREVRYGAALRIASRASSGMRFLSNGPALSVSGVLDAIRPIETGKSTNPVDALSYGLEAGFFDAFFLRTGSIKREGAATRSTWGTGLALRTGTVILRGDYAHLAGADGVVPQESTNAFGLGLAYDF